MTKRAAVLFKAIWGIATVSTVSHNTIEPLCITTTKIKPRFMTILKSRWNSCGLSKCCSGHQGQTFKKSGDIYKCYLQILLKLNSSFFPCLTLKMRFFSCCELCKDNSFNSVPAEHVLGCTASVNVALQLACKYPESSIRAMKYMIITTSLERELYLHTKADDLRVTIASCFPARKP